MLHYTGSSIKSTFFTAIDFNNKKINESMYQQKIILSFLQFMKYKLSVGWGVMQIIVKIG